jgi:D-alanine-D-alanine ligase
MSKEKSIIDCLDRSKIKVLYLAKYAPKSDEEMPPIHEIDGVLPRYHYEMFKVISELGFDVLSSNNLDILFTKGKNFDYVFTLYSHAHFLGSEVFVSTVCEYLSIPYLGATPHIRALAEDKHLTKIFAKHFGVPTPKWKLYRTIDDSMEEPSFKGPYILKPRFEGDSVGITEDCIQEEWNEILPQLKHILSTYGDAIVEEFISGTNVTVPIIGGNPPLIIPAVLNRSKLKGELETFYQKKFIDETSERTIFNSPKIESKLNHYVSKLFTEAQPMDYMRADFRIPYNEDTPMFLEMNVTGTLGSHSDIAMPARHIGISQKELILMILDCSFKRQNVLWE